MSRVRRRPSAVCDSHGQRRRNRRDTRHRLPLTAVANAVSNETPTTKNNVARLNIPDHARGVLAITVRTLFVRHVTRERFAITVANPVIFKRHVYRLRDNIDGVASQLPTMGSLLRRLCSEKLIAVWSQRIASPRQSLKILKTGIIC